MLTGMNREVPGRALSGATIADPGMTNELCVSECESRGFSFAATQYYTECCKDTHPAVSRLD